MCVIERLHAFAAARLQDFRAYPAVVHFACFICLGAVATTAAAAQFNADFNSGLPSGTVIAGSAFVDSSGGVGNSGALKLTLATGGQIGGFAVADFASGAAVTNFSVRFKLLIGGGFDPPADGLSLNFGNGIGASDSLAWEEGENTGFAATFDTWDNGGTDTAPAIDLKLNGQIIASQSMAGTRSGGRAPAGPILTNSAGGQVSLTTSPPASVNPNPTNFVDVQIVLFGDNTVSVSFSNVLVFSHVSTQYAPISGGTWVFGGRTGGANADHWIDDLQMVANFTPGPTITNQPASSRACPGGPTTFTVAATGNGALTYQWYFNGNAIQGATGSSYTIPSVAASDAGNYTVVVSDLTGSATSATATLSLTNGSSVFFDFNAPDQFANNFQISVPGLLPAAFTYYSFAGGGVGGSPAIDFGPNAASQDSTAVFMNSAYDFSFDGAVLNISMLVKLKSPSANNRLLQLGFLNRPSTLTGERLTAFMSLRASSTAFPALSYGLQSQSKVNIGATTIDGTTTATTTLVAGNWYKLSATFTNIKGSVAGAYTSSGNLQDMGPNGLSGGSNVLTWPTITTVNADIANDSSVFAAFRGLDSAGADLLDNFSVSVGAGNLTIACNPTSQTVLQGRPYVIRAYLSGPAPLTYQWNRNGIPIPGLTDWQITNSVADLSDAGIYSLTVNGNLTSAGAPLNVLPDLQGPTLVSVGSFDGWNMGACFNEAVDPVSATTPANYIVTGGPQVASAVLRPDGRSVTLALAGALSGSYSVQASVKDLFGNTGNSSAPGNVNTAGLTLVDINNPIPPGKVYTCADGEYELTAGGQDIWGGSSAAPYGDQFSYAYLQKSGDFDVRVLVTNETYNIGNGGQITKAGLLARESLDPGSRTIHSYVMPAWPGLNRYETGLRSSPNANTVGWGIAGDLANQGNVAANHPTSWIRLRRVGDTFTAYTSSDGATWTANGQTTVVFSNRLYLGLLMCAHSTTFSSATLPTNYSSSALFKNFGATPGYGSAVISLTTDIRPLSTNIAAFQTIAFNIGATISGAPTAELQYQWQRSDGAGGFTNIPAANAASANYTTPALPSSAAGSQWRCIVSAAGALSVTSAVATVSNIIDTAGPTITAAYAPTGSVQQVVAVFSEPVSVGTADVPANYALTNSALPSVAVTGASFYGTDGQTIVLAVSPALSPGTICGLFVSNVRDRSANANVIAPNSYRQFIVPPSSAQSSNIVVERFLDNSAVILTSFANSAPRTSVDALLAEPKFVNNAPDVVNYVSSFGWNTALTNSGLDNYGARLSSYFVPPSNGVYRFYTRSDDLNRLFMNSNAANSTDPVGKIVIADENIACCRNYGDTSGGPNVSPNIPLVAGQQYYIEALFKDGIGGDGFSMAVREAGDPSTPANTEVAPASYFQLPTGPAAVASISPASAAVAENGFATFSVSGISGALPYKFQWFQGNNLVPSATAFSFRAGPFGLNDTNVSFVVSNYFSRAVITANVTVTPDTTPPTAIRAYGDPSLTDVTISFSEKISPGTATNKNNYQIAGLTVLAATMQANGTNVVLATSAQTQGQSYTVTINNVQDRAVTPNTIAANSTVSFSAWVIAFNSIKIELFANNLALPLPKTTVPDLLQEPKFINNLPDIVLWTTSFSWNQSLSNTRDNYGGRISAYFVPPSNGVYRFYIRSDDLSQLSMNPYGADPLQKIVIAEQSVACCKTYGDTSGGPNVSGGIPLAAGQKYYMEALFKEGIGGDGFTMAWREAGATDTPVNGEAASSINFLSADNPDQFGVAQAVSIVQQPADATVMQNHTATFSVGAQSLSPSAIGYQWQRNGIDIPNANTASYTTPPLQLADNSALYSVKVTIPGRLVTSRQALLHVIADTQGPSVVAAFGDPVPTHLRVVFNELVSAVTATDANNYLFDGGQVVTNATLLKDGKTVLLSLDSPIAPSTYTIDVVGVRDLAGNIIQSGTSAPFSAPWLRTNSVALREQFFNNTTDLPRGLFFSALTNNPTFPNNPGSMDYVTSLDSPQSVPDTDHFSARLIGFLIPPVSGNYYFQLTADDSGWLLISQDAGSANATTIARGEGACGACNGLQGSVTLTAGNAYYIEALMMEGTLNDYLDVLWKTPGSTSFQIIDGNNLAYSINPDAALRITTQPTNVTVLQGRTATFVAAASGAPAIHYQWQSYDSSQGWLNISGATNGSYSIIATGPATQMVRMLALQSGPLVNATLASQPATLTFQSDGPVLLEVSSLGGSIVKARFDEPLWQPDAENLGSWSLPNGVTLISAQLIGDSAGVGNTVLLGVQGLNSNPFTVCGFLEDVWGNGSLSCITGQVFAAGSLLDIDEPVGNFAIPDPFERGSSIATSNRLEITAGGSDIWNNADGFRYAHGKYTNDFDIRVRVSRVDARNRWSKAGLVVREDLTPGARNLSAMMTAGPSICGGVSACDGSGDTANDFEAGMRLTTDGPTSDWANLDHPWGVAYPNGWIRLRRAGNTFTAYSGNNGVTWTPYAVTTQSFAPVLFVGPGASSHNNYPGQTTTAVFNDYAQVFPPAIIAQPPDRSVECTSAATFTIGATGTEITYQWYYNNTILPGQTNTSLSLSNLTLSAGGNYFVVVSNFVGSVTSRIAQLTVTDTVPPVMTLLGASPISIECHTSFNDPGATAVDSCAGDLTAQIQVSGSLNLNAVGSYTRYYTSIDPASNSVQVSRTINVVDHTPPILTPCPANRTVFATNGNSTTVSYSVPTATDACDPAPTVLCAPASGTTFSVGTNTVTCTGVDASGNSSYCSFTLTVVRRLIVLNTNDSGSGSLRQTITDANATLEPDTITFLIDGPAPHTIAPLSQLPEITAPVIIDGWSQPGFAGHPVIEMDGRFVNNAVGLAIFTSNCVVRGLAIYGFASGEAMLLQGAAASNNWICGNYLGLNAAGSVSGSNQIGIVLIDSPSFNLIGSDADGQSDDQERNVISANSLFGILVNTGGAQFNRIAGNYIGTDPTGLLPRGNQFSGILFSSAGPSNQVGGPLIASRNVICDNVQAGIQIASSVSGSTIIQGNFIGLCSDGTTALGNKGWGIATDSNGSLIGGLTPAAANIIAHNTNAGVRIQGGAHFNAVLGNAIYSNGGLGIAVDAPLASARPAPTITAIGSVINTAIEGSFSGPASASFRIEFFANTAADPSGYGEGETFLGFLNASSPGNFRATFPGSVPVAHFITATITDAENNTSAFSAALAVPSPMAPVIGSPPQSTNVPPGANVTFCVSATGSPQLFYQWRKNGRNIVGETNSCLTLLNVQVADGGSYTVAIQNEAGAVLSAPAVLNVNVPPVPAGNDFVNRVRISGTNGLISGTNTGATKEVGEPAHAGNRGGASVWYVWQAPATGIASFDTIGSTFDTLLGIYKGTNVTQLTLVVDDDDGGGSFASKASFNAIAGVDYAVAIDGSGGAVRTNTGNFILHWVLEVTAQQIPVIVNPPTSVAVAPGASHTFSVMPQNTNLIYQFQWFFNGQPIVGATNQTLTISNITEAMLGSYTVDVSSAGRLVETKAASLQINLTGTETQLVLAFDKFDDAVNSPTQLRLGTPSGQGPGLLGTPKGVASIARGYTGLQIFNNYGASSEGGEETHCGQICGVSEWVPFVAEETGRLYVDTGGSSFDTVLAVYISVNGAYSQVGCDNNSGANLTSKLDVPVQAGKTNFLVADGVGGVTGSLHVNYSLVTPSTITTMSMSGGAFHLHIVGHAGMKVAIQASSNLSSWSTLTTITAVTSAIDFTETPLPSGPSRFYRAVMLP